MDLRRSRTILSGLPRAGVRAVNPGMNHPTRWPWIQVSAAYLQVTAAQDSWHTALIKQVQTQLVVVTANHPAFLTFSRSIPKAVSNHDTGLGTTSFKRAPKSAYCVWQNFLPAPRRFGEVRKEGGCLKVPLKITGFLSHLWSFRSLPFHGLSPQKFSHSFVKHQLPLAVAHCCLVHFSHLGNQEGWDLKGGNQSWENTVFFSPITLVLGLWNGTKF